VRVRPLTLILCAVVLAAGTALAVGLLTRGTDPPPVTAIELGDATATPTPTSEFAPPRDDDDPDDDDPFDDDDGD
jgi:hypothetical protein